jgi:hypothetical protein
LLLQEAFLLLLVLVLMLLQPVLGTRGGGQWYAAGVWAAKGADWSEATYGSMSQTCWWWDSSAWQCAVQQQV